MKRIFLFLFLFSTAVGRCGDCKDRAQVAMDFLNQYVAFRDAKVKAGQTMDIEGWLASNNLVTKEFISGYKEELEKGLAEEGWDSDVILDNQDYPDKGFKLLRCLDKQGYVVLQGVDWPEFTVTVLVVATDRGVKVKGSGVVNIPKKLQAQK